MNNSDLLTRPCVFYSASVFVISYLPSRFCVYQMRKQPLSLFHFHAAADTPSVGAAFFFSFLVFLFHTSLSSFSFSFPCSSLFFHFSPRQPFSRERLRATFAFSSSSSSDFWCFLCFCAFCRRFHFRAAHIFFLTLLLLKRNSKKAREVRVVVVRFFAPLDVVVSKLNLKGAFSFKFSFSTLTI